MLLPSPWSCGGERRAVVISGDTSRLRADADAVTDSDLDSESDLDSAALLRVVLLARREYCTFGSSSSLLIKGERLLCFYRYDADDTMRMRRYQVGFGFDLLLR